MTSIKRLSAAEFLAGFNPKNLGAIRERAAKPGTVALVRFENQQLDSTAFGDSSALPIGEPWTYKSLDDVEGKWLNDLPSQRQYPVAYVPASELLPSWVGQVRVAGETAFVGNALRFATKQEAEGYVAELALRWTAVADTRAVETQDPVTHVWADGALRVYLGTEG